MAEPIPVREIVAGTRLLHVVTFVDRRSATNGQEEFLLEWLEGLGWWPDVGRVLAGWWGVSQPELTLLSLSLLISPLVEATKFGNPSGSRFTVQGAF